MKIKEDHKDHRNNKMQKQENNILPEYQTLPPDSIAPEYPSLAGRISAEETTCGKRGNGTQ